MPSALLPRTVVDQYVVEGAIGAGSMGDVFLGTDTALGRKIALKILSERHRDNQELRARFVREARAVASIQHPNVVQVFTTGTFDDRPYIAMEFLDGVDLGSAVRENGPMGSLQAARCVLDSARGLDAAARAGLIHRDVKPSNLVLLHDGSTKVTDFGLVRPVNPGDEPALTALGVVVGTPDYIAPEQARGDPIDERVDIYALGGSLYYLLTGRPPFRTGNPNDDKYLKVVARHLREPAPDARVLSKDADTELSKLARAMMSKKPVDRPGYAELMEQLIGIVERLGGRDSSGLRPLPQSRPASGGYVSPTPFVGGAAPRARDLTGPNPIAPGAVTANLGNQAFVEEDPADAAPTNVRMPTFEPDAERPVVARPRVSKLLVGITVISVLIFLTGLVLLLAGPMPDRPDPKATARDHDAGAAP